jgi:hypothetical protein
MRAWNCCWNCWKVWGKGIILLACVAAYVAPAKAAGCADLQPFQTAVNEARKKEDAASDAKNRLHDSDRPKPVPAEIRQKLPDKPVWTRADYDNAANQARADAESHIRRLTENLEKINRLRADGAETQKKIKALLDKIDALPDDDKPKSERALGAARQALAAAQRERDEKAPALQAQIARSEQAVKSRLAIPGALGLAVSTPGEIADAMQKLENTDPAEAGLVSPQIIAMRAEIAAQDKIIAECARKADGLIEKPDEWNANNDKLEKAKADKTAAERALAVAQNEAHRQALGLLNQLFKERRELTDLGQAIEKHKGEIVRLENTPGAADKLQQEVEALEKEYRGRVRADFDTFYTAKVEEIQKSLEEKKSFRRTHWSIGRNGSRPSASMRHIIRLRTKHRWRARSASAPSNACRKR